MKNLIAILLIAGLTVNCEDSGTATTDSTTSQPSQGKSARFLTQAYADLGPLAQATIDLDSRVAFEYNNKYTADGLLDIYTDWSVLTATRAFVNAYVKDDSAGSYYLAGNTPEDAFDHLVTNATTLTTGLDRQDICLFLADIYEDFGAETRVVYLSIPVNSYAPGGLHCLTEVNTPDGWLVQDPIFNVSYSRSSGRSDTAWLDKTTNLSATDMIQLVPYVDGVSGAVFLANPDGRVNHPDQLSGSITYDTYYQIGSFSAIYAADDLMIDADGNYAIANYSDHSNR